MIAHKRHTVVIV